MTIRWIRSKWDFPDTPLQEFLTRIHQAGFDGSEIYLPALADRPDEVRRLHTDLKLRLVGQKQQKGRSANRPSSTLQSAVF